MYQLTLQETIIGFILDQGAQMIKTMDLSYESMFLNIRVRDL
jgi:hypothetical protein